METPMRLSPHLLMNDKNFTVYMSSRPLANTASELTLEGAGMALAGSYHTIRELVTFDTCARFVRYVVTYQMSRAAIYGCGAAAMGCTGERSDHTAPLSHHPTRQCHCAEWGQHYPRHRPALHRRRQQGEGLKKARRTSWEVRRALLNPRLAGGRTPTLLCLR